MSVDDKHVDFVGPPAPPLMGRKVGITATGLIGEIANFMIKDVPTHPDWCESLAACLVGTIAGRGRYIINKFGMVNGNLFTIYVGASRLGFKTVPLKMATRPMLKAVSAIYNKEACLEFGITPEEYNTRWWGNSNASQKEKNSNEWKLERAFLNKVRGRFINVEMPESFTSEALASWLTTYPVGMICSDEFTSMVKGASKKDYMSTVMEVLSRLYDGEMEKKTTIARGIEESDKIHVSFASATTPYVMTLMDETFFWQGTGNRILWIVDEDVEKLDESDLINMGFFYGMVEKVEQENEFNRLVNLLAGIRKLPDECVMLLTPDAAIELDKFRVVMYNQAAELFAEDMMNRDSSFLAGMAQNAMKLALVHSIGRYAIDPEMLNVGLMDIEIVDARWAIEKVMRHMHYYNKLWEISARVRKGALESYKTDEERVISIITRFEKLGKRVTPNILRQQTHWDRQKGQNLLDTMIMNGDIRLITEIIMGKPVNYYTCKKEF